MHLEATSPEYLPEGQVAQVDEPIVSAYFPGTQPLHREAPPVLNLPVEQSLHWLIALREANFPDGHDLHEALPVVDAYAPALQSKQAWLPYPGAYCPTVHAIHAVDAVSAAAKPAEQRVHSELPVPAAYFPGTQLLQ